MLKLEKKAINHYNLKFCDKDMEDRILQTIKSLKTEEKKLKDHIKQIMLSGLDRKVELFPTIPHMDNIYYFINTLRMINSNKTLNNT